MSSHSHSCRVHSPQRGFGLIELMVSLAIASFLVLGLVVMAGNTQRTFSTQTDLAGVGDKERFASVLLGANIETAGYFTFVTSPWPTVAPTVNSNFAAAPLSGGNFAIGQFLSGTSGPPDMLSLRFYATAGDPDTPSNCQGGTVTATTHTYESMFTIANGNLVCAVGVDGAAPANPIVMIDGVSNMAVLYGVDTKNTGSANEYMNATAVAAANLWGKVHTVQVTLTFAPTAQLPAVNYTQTFQVMHGYPY